MRICDPTEAKSGIHRTLEIPLEVSLWLNRGWVIIPTERQGIVLRGKKKLRRRDRILLWLGCIGLVLALEGVPFSGVLGALFLAIAGLNYGWKTTAPTMFFPTPGEKPRGMHR